MRGAERGTRTGGGGHKAGTPEETPETVETPQSPEGHRESGGPGYGLDWLTWGLPPHWSPIFFICARRSILRITLKGVLVGTHEFGEVKLDTGWFEKRNNLDGKSRRM